MNCCPRCDQAHNSVQDVTKSSRQGTQLYNQEGGMQTHILLVRIPPTKTKQNKFSATYQQTARCQLKPQTNQIPTLTGDEVTWVTITATQRKGEGRGGSIAPTSIYSNHQELWEQTTQVLLTPTKEIIQPTVTSCVDGFPMTYRCSFQTNEDKSRDKQLYPNLCRMRHCITSEKTRLDKRGQQRV